MSSRKTRNALLVSVLSMLLCVAMLLATTFAWFTDTATNSGNKIQAGNLKIDLLQRGGINGSATGAYSSIKNQTASIFSADDYASGSNKTLWEPGATHVAYLAVQNKGNLALKYNIVIDVTDGGLVGALEYAIVPQGKTCGTTPELADTVASWEDAKTRATAAGNTPRDIEAGRFTAAPNGCLKKIADAKTNTDETDYFALVVHMKEDAGDQYQNKSIDIDVTVVATQVDAEEDAFDNTYDSKSTYPALAAFIDKSASYSGNFAQAKNVASTASQQEATQVTAMQDITLANNSAVTLIKEGTTLSTSNGTSDVAITTTNDNAGGYAGSITSNIKTTNATSNSVTYKISYTYKEGDTETPVSKFSNIVTNIFDVSTGLTDVEVYTTHGGQENRLDDAAKLATPETPSSASHTDKTFYYDSLDGKLYIYSSEYSDFRMTYKYDFVAAVDAQGYNTLKEAFEVADAAGKTVVLLKDYTLTAAEIAGIPDGVAFDSNGYTVTRIAEELKNFDGNSTALKYFAGGEGTEAKPYQIGNAAQWSYAGDCSYYNDIMNFELVNDIDFNYTEPNGWAGDGFTLNGNGHTLKNATGCLFNQNWTYSLYLKDLTLYNCVSDYSLICAYGSYSVSTKQEYINVDVINCTAKGGSFFVPWVYGEYTTNFKDCDITNSILNNDVTCQGYVAGFAGNSKAAVTIDNCTMQATITSSAPIVAGFLGSNGTVKNSAILPGTIIKQKGSNGANAVTGSGTVVDSTCYATIIAASASQVNKNGFDATVAYSASDLGFDASSFVVNNDGSVEYNGTATIATLKICQYVTTNRLRDGVFENGGFPTPIGATVDFENVTTGAILNNAVNYVTSVRNVATEATVTDKLDCLVATLPGGLVYNDHGFVFADGVLYLDADQGAEYTSNYFAGTLKGSDTATTTAITVYYSAYDADGGLLGTVTGSYQVTLDK